MKIKAAILIKQREPLVVDEITLNSTLQYGQVLVRIKYSGICGSQIGEIMGVKGPDHHLPHLLGHEGGAIVEEIGPGVTRVKPGDHVVMHWKKAAGIEAAPPKYYWNNKIINAGWLTTFNNYAVVSENRITPILKTTDLRFAALMGCAILTGFGVINNDAQVKIGQSVVVFGVGGVGLSLVQAAALVSAYPIVGIDLADHKLMLAKQLGLTHGININKENANQEKNLESIIKNIVGDQGADVVIDTTGFTRIIEQAYTLTAAQGKTILVGVPKIGDHISIYSLPLHFQKILKGSHGGDAVPHQDIPRYIKLIEQSKLDLNPLITEEYSLDQINEAITGIHTGKSAGRTMIQMESK